MKSLFLVSALLALGGASVQAQDQNLMPAAELEVLLGQSVENNDVGTLNMGDETFDDVSSIARPRPRPRPVPRPGYRPHPRPRPRPVPPINHPRPYPRPLPRPYPYPHPRERVACYAEDARGYKYRAIGYYARETQRQALRKCHAYAAQCFALGCNGVYLRTGD